MMYQWTFPCACFSSVGDLKLAEAESDPANKGALPAEASAENTEAEIDPAVVPAPAAPSAPSAPDEQKDGQEY